MFSSANQQTDWMLVLTQYFKLLNVSLVLSFDLLYNTEHWMNKFFSVCVSSAWMQAYFSVGSSIMCPISFVVLYMYDFFSVSVGLFIWEKLSRLGGEIIPTRYRHNANFHQQKSSIHMSRKFPRLNEISVMSRIVTFFSLLSLQSDIIIASVLFQQCN